MGKQVAGTLVNILDNPLMQAVLDSTASVEKFATDMISRWSMDLYTRKPGPAITEDGKFKGTDLDLACFLMALVDRGAVINLPSYKSKRQTEVKEGQRLLSKENRHGKVISLSAHQQVFSFSIRIFDNNIIAQDPQNGQEATGDFRNFMLVDIDGSWYEGWKRIEFMPSAMENNFLNDHSLWSGHSVIFKNFVHPNRWVSLYGQYYFQTKALIQRMSHEAQFLNTEIKRLQAAGVRYPITGEGAKKVWPKSHKVGEAKSVKVDAMEVEVDLPAFSGEYDSIEATQEELVRITDLRKSWVNKIVPMLRFATRTVELAFFKHGMKDGVPKMPSWISGAEWEKDFVLPGKRNKWNRLILFQPAVGEFGVAIRYRLFQKSERVAKD